MNTQNPEMANVILGQFEHAAPSKRHINLTLERHYNTTTSDLWNAVTDPDRLARWFAAVSGDLREGGNFIVDFEEGDPSQIASGKITRCRAPEELRASWNFPGEAESSISVSIRKDNGGALLKLEHLGLSETAAAEYGAGWQAYIEALLADFRGDQARGPAWDHRWSALLPDYQQLLENAG